MKFITKKIYVWKALSPYKMKFGFAKFFGYYQMSETKSIGFYFGKYILVITKILDPLPPNEEVKEFRHRIKYAGKKDSEI